MTEYEELVQYGRERCGEHLEARGLPAARAYSSQDGDLWTHSGPFITGYMARLEEAEAEE